MLVISFALLFLSFFCYSLNLKKTVFFENWFYFFVLGILIYVATFIAYLNGMTLNNFK